MAAPPDGYIDIYKLAVEMADRISARRAVASSFFLTVLSTLVALIGVLKTDEWALAAPGLLLAIAWLALLTSYRRLNRAKFTVIQRMEDRLPASPYKDEWEILKNSSTPVTLTERYFELGLIEQSVPIVFGIVFLGILVGEVV